MADFFIGRHQDLDGGQQVGDLILELNSFVLELGIPTIPASQSKNTHVMHLVKDFRVEVEETLRDPLSVLRLYGLLSMSSVVELLELQA